MEIVDSDFYITDGLCEDMRSQNPIDFFNIYFELEIWKYGKIDLKRPDIDV